MRGVSLRTTVCSDRRPWVCGGFRGGLLLLAVFPSSGEVRGGFPSVSLCFRPIYFCFDWFRFASVVVSFTIVLLCCCLDLSCSLVVVSTLVVVADVIWRCVVICFLVLVVIQLCWWWSGVIWLRVIILVFLVHTFVIGGDEGCSC
jgi:hypothetical protein